MTAQVWDKAPVSYWDHYWISARRTSIRSRSTAAIRPRLRWGPGLQLDVAEPDANSYDIAPDGTEIAVAADVDRTGIDENFDIFVLPIGGGAPRNLTSGQPGQRRRPTLQPGWQAARVSPADDQGLLRRPRAAA